MSPENIYSLGTKVRRGIAVTETKWIETILTDMKIATGHIDDEASSLLRAGKLLELEQDYLYSITSVTSNAVDQGSSVTTTVNAVLAYAASLDDFRPPQAQRFLLRALIRSVNLLHAGVFVYVESLEQLDKYLASGNRSGVPGDGSGVGNDGSSADGSGVGNDGTSVDGSGVGNDGTSVDGSG